MNPGITIIGLGPGESELLTRQAWETLNEIPEIYLRTIHHPAVRGFPRNVKVHSFDQLYDKYDTFEEVYAQIVERLIELAKRPQGVVYAVPGHPNVAEATTQELVRRAGDGKIPVKIIEGLSFIEATYAVLNEDPLPRTALVDALHLSKLHHPPFPPDAPALIAQIYSPAVASDVKLTLMASYPDHHSVQLVHGAGTAQVLVETLPLFEIDRSPHFDLLTSLYVPSLGESTSFESFQEIVAHLRAPEGCPWDREQTHLSLRPYLMEEAYEVLAALDAENQDSLLEELGDLLLQIVLHAQIASELGEFTMAGILKTIHEKLVRRHPHVFGDLVITDARKVIENWERLKSAEREHLGKSTSGILDGVDLALPALFQAETYQNKVAAVGFDWTEIGPVKDKITEELREVDAATTDDEREVELGDLLFSVVNLARWLDIDAESSLRMASARFRERFMRLEESARRQGKQVGDLPVDELDSLWSLADKNR